MGDDETPRKILHLNHFYDSIYNIYVPNLNKTIRANKSHILTLIEHDRFLIYTENKNNFWVHFIDKGQYKQVSLYFYLDALDFVAQKKRQEENNVTIDISIKKYLALPEIKRRNCFLFYSTNRELGKNCKKNALYFSKGFHRDETIFDIIQTEHISNRLKFVHGFIFAQYQTWKKSNMIFFASRKEKKCILNLLRGLGLPYIFQDMNCITIHRDIYETLLTSKNNLSMYRFIINARYKKSRVVGMNIDGNGRFKLSNNIVTHNTMMSIYLATHYKIPTVIMTHLNTVKDGWLSEIQQHSNGKAIIVKKEKDFSLPYDFYIIGIKKMCNISDDAVRHIGMVIIDEAHIATMAAFTHAALKFQPKYLIGLSATPRRQDNLEQVFEIFFGKNVILRKDSKLFYVIKYKTDYIPTIENIEIWGKQRLNNKLYEKSLYCNKERNQTIALIAKVYERRTILILCGRVQQIKDIEKFLMNELPHKIIDTLHGSKSSYKKDCDILVAGIKKAGVGFNDPRLNLLILACEVKDVEQYAGRIRALDKIIIDLVDKHRICENKWNLRKEWYLDHSAVIK
jgi:hypothetical protein